MDTHKQIRSLCLVLGDQLNHDSTLWHDFDPRQDLIALFEVKEESTHPLSSKQRTALFFSSMRHFAEELREKQLPVFYSTIAEQHRSISDALTALIRQQRPEKLRLVLPGDTRVLTDLQTLCKTHDLDLELLADHHFISRPGEFSRWLKKMKQPRMEYWYREMRKTRQILLDEHSKPLGGKWNYDQDNRQTFSHNGPDITALKPLFTPDAITQAAIRDINNHLPQLPGKLDQFSWPVCREQALLALDQFIEQRLPLFGQYQDAMWIDEPFLYHSWLSSSLNLKLLNPMEVIGKAVQALEQGNAPLNSVEGFIRQIIGWREYVRGLYWTHHTDWEQMNWLQHSNRLPNFYWTADTQMKCLQQSISQVLDAGYGHHIQRLMITGLFALLSKVDPQQVHRWYLAMYVDAVAWVEIPNTLGMSQFADGGIVASKPYIASGNYISRMSNYCSRCPYNPKQATGDQACPFTTLYWGFIADNQSWLSQNPRLAMQTKHWENKEAKEKKAILTRRDEVIHSLQIEAE
ncbi:cryptochrome/photolyase family protein [Neptuniibacter halophilus]|uniref:cryptochrome/photolyase family protein n=1 Tax=Neptuniibacter halophilus TaxID=651666 RepID=UPI002573AE64|nr:cryptochrome/photolyase family protein [Neptuniibacter halophilus]